MAVCVYVYGCVCCPALFELFDPLTHFGRLIEGEEKGDSNLSKPSRPKEKEETMKAKLKEREREREREERQGANNRLNIDSNTTTTVHKHITHHV